MGVLAWAVLLLPFQDDADGRFQALVGKLRSDSIAEREEASRELSFAALRRPSEVLPAVEAAADSEDAELRARAGAILEGLGVVQVGRGHCQLIRLRWGGKPVEGAMVVLEGEGPPALPAAEPVRVTIRDGALSPRSLFLPPGSRVEIENAGPNDHAVCVRHATGPFERFLVELEPGRRHAVELPRPVRLSLACGHGEHPAERQWLWVTGSRARGITGPLGTVVFRGMPAGRYTLKVWHERRGELVRTLQVDGDAAHDLEFGDLMDVLTEDYRGFGLPLPPPEARLAIHEPGGLFVSNGVRQRDYHLVFLLEPETANRPARVFMGMRSRVLKGDRFHPATTDAGVLSMATVPGFRAPFHIDFDLAMAVQCADRGWRELASALLGRALGEEPFADDARAAVARLAWNFWCNALAEKDSDRAAVGKRLQVLIDSPYGLDTEENRSLLEDLALTLVPSEALPGSVESLIDDLIDLCPEPGYPGEFAGRFKSEEDAGTFEPRYRRLWWRGLEAVPQLFKHLEDTRLVRHIEGGFAHGARHSRVCDVVADILRDLSCDRLKLQERDYQRGYSLDPVQAEAWWTSARALGEERYLLQNVIPHAGLNEYGENDHLLHILAARYPHRLPELYEATVDRWPQGHNGGSARLLEKCPIPKDVKIALFLKAARNGSRLQRLIALGPLLRLGHPDAVTILIDTLRSLPATPEVPYWHGDALSTAWSVMETDDPRAWSALEETARRVDVGQRMQMLEGLTCADAEGTRAERRLAFLRGFLEDGSLRTIRGEDEGKFAGPCAGFCFPRLRVRDLAAMELASLLKLDADPDPSWGEADWDALRERVRAGQDAAAERKALLDRLLADYLKYDLPLPPITAPLVKYEVGTTTDHEGESQPLVALGFLTKEARAGQHAEVLIGTMRMPVWGKERPVPVKPEPGVEKGVQAGINGAQFDTYAVFATALQCHARGWKDLANALFDFAMGKPFDHRIEREDYDRRASPETEVAFLAWAQHANDLFLADTDRSAILRRLKVLIAAEPRLNVDCNRDLIASLEATLVPGRGERGGAEALIDDLVELAPADFGDPPPRMLALIERGLDAVPALIEHLDDRRLTRFYSTGLGSHVASYPWTVGGICSVLLGNLVGREEAGTWKEEEWKRRAQAWFEAARAKGEERYLVENALPPGNWPNHPVLRVLSKKYPEHLDRLYRDLLEKRREMESWPVAEQVARSGLPRDRKLDLLKTGARDKSLEHRFAALRVLPDLDAEAFVTNLVETLDGLPETVTGKYWMSREASFGYLVRQTADPRAWKALAAAARRADVGLRLELMDGAVWVDAEGEIRARSVEFLREFLADATLRAVAGDPLKFDGLCAARRFPRIEVRNVAAMWLAPLLGLEADPEPGWADQQWSALRERVRKALPP